MKKSAKQSRQLRVRSKTKGTDLKPRLSVFRSNKFIYAQVIDDSKAATIASVSESEVKASGNKSARAIELGKLVSKKALAKKISTVVFDRGSYKYHGRVKAVADGAR